MKIYNKLLQELQNNNKVIITIKNYNILLDSLNIDIEHFSKLKKSQWVYNAKLKLKIEQLKQWQKILKDNGKVIINNEIEYYDLLRNLEKVDCDYKRNKYIITIL